MTPRRLTELIIADRPSVVDLAGLTLLIPDKADVERDALAAAWEAAGGAVLRLARFWDPPPLDPARVRVYGSDSFCLVLQLKLGLTLLSPPEDSLSIIPNAS